MKKSELKTIIKEIFQDYKKEQLNEIAFSKKAKWTKWHELAEKYKSDIPNNIVDKFFDELLNPEKKNLTGNIGQYIKIFKNLKLTKEDKISVINKVLNDLPKGTFVLVPINKGDQNHLPKNFIFNFNGIIYFLKNIDEDITFRQSFG